jgi:hypothetical protein
VQLQVKAFQRARPCSNAGEELEGRASRQAQQRALPGGQGLQVLRPQGVPGISILIQLINTPKVLYSVTLAKCEHVYEGQAEEQEGRWAGITRVQGRSRWPGGRGT